jgi:hypothetical protein
MNAIIIATLSGKTCTADGIAATDPTPVLTLCRADLHLEGGRPCNSQRPSLARESAVLVTGKRQS